MSATVEEARRVLAGVTVTPVSPFTSRGDLDLEAAAAHAERLAVSGIRSVAVAGNTGEFYALTTEEVDRLVGVWREAAGPGMFLWMGVSGSQADVRRRLVSARERGAQGALLHSPPHTYLSEGGMKRYLETVLDEAQAEGLVVALYKRDARVPDSVIVALSRHPALAGVKYAVNDLMAVSRLVHDLDGTVPVVCGTAEVWAAAFATVGARGFTSVLGGVAPRLSLTLQRAMEQDDLAGVRRIVALVAPFERMRQEQGSALNIPAVKAAMSWRGWPQGPVRPPLEDLDDLHEKVLGGILVAWEEAGAWL